MDEVIDAQPPPPTTVEVCQAILAKLTHVEEMLGKIKYVPK
jgi:hypothetical protein